MSGLRLSTATGAAVTTRFVSYAGCKGNKIVAAIDSAAEHPGDRPFVVMAPKYGETKKNNLQLAYYLAANGLSVLRFDHTCHVGESDGEVTEFTLPDAAEDIIHSVDFVEREYGQNEVTLVSSSLSGRSALRAAMTEPRIAHLVCIVGVLNVQYTFREIYKEDFVEHYRKGKRWGVIDILGHDLNLDHFLGAAIDANMHDVEGTVEDVKAIRVPVTYLSAESDAWVDPADVSRALTRPNVTVEIIRGALHEVRENPKAADFTFRKAVVSCIDRNAGDELMAEIVVPDKRMIIAQNKLERERLQKRRPRTESEEDFWSSYLEKYQFVENFGDYQEYMDLVVRLLGPIETRHVLLDAGCGNGLLGAWVLRRIIEEERKRFDIRPVYFGIDLSEKGLSDAYNRHIGFATGGESGVSTNEGMQMLYSCVDLDEFTRNPGFEYRGLSIRENTFDKICCSLLISYLEEPDKVIEKFYSLLKPGGVIVVSSMKPYCDMSAIYRDFMEQRANPEEIESARRLLQAAGKIKLKEELGYYRFFSGQEMKDAARKAGYKAIESHVSFGGQAHLIKAEK